MAIRSDLADGFLGNYESDGFQDDVAGSNPRGAMFRMSAEDQMLHLGLWIVGSLLPLIEMFSVNLTCFVQEVNRMAVDFTQRPGSFRSCVISA